MLGGAAVLWGGQCQVGTAATAQCSSTAQVAPHCSVPHHCPSCQGLSQTASCVYILLFCLPWEKVGLWWLLLLCLAGGLVIARPGLFCGHTCW